MESYQFEHPVNSVKCIGLAVVTVVGLFRCLFVFREFIPDFSPKDSVAGSCIPPGASLFVDRPENSATGNSCGTRMC